jgi:hypothetical protein
MCTVSYLPLPQGGFILTSNRDEAPQRNAVFIQKELRAGHRLIYPKDPEAGGTWFAMSDHGRIICLLNGAFESFLPSPQFTYSRGRVLLDFLVHHSPDEYLSKAELSHTAPCTMVTLDGDTLHEVIWDGNRLHHQILDPSSPAFWSSVTLYPPEVRAERKAFFTEWTKSNAFEQEAIMHFHRYGGKDDLWNGFVMNRNDRVKTLSITSVKKEQGNLHMLHSDLKSGMLYSENLELAPAHAEKD